MGDQRRGLPWERAAFRPRIPRDRGGAGARRPGDDGGREARRGRTRVAASRSVTGSEQRAAVDPYREAPRGESAPTGVILAAVAAASFAAMYFEVSLMKLVSVMYYSIFVYAV